MHQYQPNNTILRWWQNPLLCANMCILQKFHARASVMCRSRLILWHHAHLHTHENKHCDCAARGGLRSGVINFCPQTGLCAAEQPLSTDTGLFEPRRQTYQLPLHTNRPGRRSTDCSLYQNVSGGGFSFRGPWDHSYAEGKYQWKKHSGWKQIIPNPKIRLGCGYSGVRHLLGNTWHESGPELSQLFGWSVSTMDRDQAWPLSPHRPIAQEKMRKHWKGAEEKDKKDAFTRGGGTGNTGWGSSRNATMAGCYAREDAQSSTHPYSSGKLISIFFPPQWSNFHHCFLWNQLN